MSALHRVDISSLSAVALLEETLEPLLPFSLPILGSIPRDVEINPKITVWATFPMTHGQDKPPVFSIFLYDQEGCQSRFFCSEDASSQLPSEEHRAHVVCAVLEYLNTRINRIDTVDTQALVKIGSLHEKWIPSLEPYFSRTVPYSKFTCAPNAAIEKRVLPPGFALLPIQVADIPLVIETSNISRTQDYIVSRIPTSACIQSPDNATIAWILMHSDGSLGTLHVHDLHRRQGLAAFLLNHMAETLRPGSTNCANGWNWGDTSPGNVKAHALFSHLTGWEFGWTCHWTFFQRDALI